MNAEFTCFGQGIRHLVQDVQTAGFGLCQGFGHDFRCNTRNLDVHLQRGDAVFGTSHFEVHVAEVIFVAEDVGQDRVIAIVFQNQTHRNTRNWRFERNASVHHGQRATTNRRHRG